MGATQTYPDTIMHMRTVTCREKSTKVCGRQCMMMQCWRSFSQWYKLNHCMYVVLHAVYMQWETNSQNTAQPVCTCTLNGRTAQWMHAAYLMSHIIHQHCTTCSSKVVGCESTKLQIGIDEAYNTLHVCS